MDIEDIKERVAEIKALQSDDEQAHNKEDGLRHDFIKMVAQVGSPELAAMATEVLKTEAIDFCRWCA